MKSTTLAQNLIANRFGIFNSKKVLPFLFFNFVVMVFYLGDSAMSYITPILLDEHFHSSAIVGLVIGFSSVAGLISDSLFTHYFCKFSYRFFMVTATLAGVIFPALLLFFPLTLVNFLIVMTIWGIYYELIYFAQFKYIRENIVHTNYPLAWGVFTSSAAISISLAPILAGSLLASITKTTLAFSFAVFATSFALFQIFRLAWRPRVHNLNEEATVVPKLEHSPISIRTYLTLSRKVWPLLLCIFAINVLDATFWTIGPLFALDFFNKSALSGVFMTLYVAPAFIVGLLAQPLAKPFGKKRIAFITLTLAGICLGAFSFISSPVIILVLVTLISLFSGVAYPELLATFEDYVNRLQEHGSHMIALQRSSVNVAYIIAPIIAGVLAGIVGYRPSFAVSGAVLILIGVISLLVVPRKITMPQKELHQEEPNHT